MPVATMQEEIASSLTRILRRPEGALRDLRTALTRFLTLPAAGEASQETLDELTRACADHQQLGTGDLRRDYRHACRDLGSADGKHSRSLHLLRLSWPTLVKVVADQLEASLLGLGGGRWRPLEAHPFFDSGQLAIRGLTRTTVRLKLLTELDAAALSALLDHAGAVRRQPCAGLLADEETWLILPLKVAGIGRACNDLVAFNSRAWQPQGRDRRRMRVAMIDGVCGRPICPAAGVGFPELGQLSVRLPLGL